MEPKAFLGCTLIAITFFSSTVSAVSQCYRCIGLACNDPFNKAESNVTYCPGSYGRIFPIGDRMKRQTSDYICIKFSYKKDKNPVETIRDCVNKEIDSKEPCKANTENMAKQNKTVQSCSTCDSDLCNSANSLENPAHFLVAFILQTVFLLSLVY